jgi:hypothetical protein
MIAPGFVAPIIDLAALCFASVTLVDRVSIGDLLVGTGTLLLAAFTALLARQTRDAVAVSERGLELSRASVEALDRPFVIASPDHEHRLLGFAEVGGDHEGWRFVYRLWNLGKGPAIVDDMSLVEATGGREFLTADESLERAVAMDPPVFDGLSRLERGAPPGAGAEMTLRIWYRSSAGARYVSISRLQVTGNLSCICTDFRQRPALAHGR